MTTTSSSSGAPDMKLFWGCFIALIATSFGFIARVLTENDWGTEFALSATEKGRILGAGLWPFAISIVLFSLIIDKIGYKKAMFFGLFCHVTSTILIVTATGYTGMYVGTIILALGSGTVEAYINPVVTTVFNKDKTKWLNILHAGWPGGLVVGGILAILLGADVAWRMKIGLILIPTVIYAVMLWKREFPVQERVAAGVSYKEMLKQVGGLGMLIIAYMIFAELANVINDLMENSANHIGLGMIGAFAVASGIGFGVYTKSLGRPLFILLLLIMMPLATTELGVDSWITNLMSVEMQNFGANAGWVLVYTSLIMMVLRFNAGPIVHRINPLGLLALSALIAAIGLIYLSKATGMAILIAATLYGVGKTFFWPTTLGIVSEQFPEGGALTLNAVAGVGMLAVGIVGAPFMGNIQDSFVDKQVMAYNQEVHADIMTAKSESIFGAYNSIEEAKLEAATPEVQDEIASIKAASQKETLATIAYLPIFMLVCYLALIFYFRSKGGYKPVEIE